MTGVVRAESTRLAIARAANSIRRACEQHALDEGALDSLLGHQEELSTAIAYVFDSDRVQPTRALMRRLADDVQEALDLTDLLDAGLPSAGERLLGALRAFVAGCAFVLSTWIVVGSIVSGQNELAATTSPVLALATLVGALFLLALLEAAHIGAVALSTADVSSLRDSHPRVFRLHRYINTKAKLEHYLAARQVGVVWWCSSCRSSREPLDFGSCRVRTSIFHRGRSRSCASVFRGR